jgi:copper chaperone CopZ
MKTLKKLAALMLLIVFPVVLSAQEKQKSTETVVYTTSISCKACVNKIMSNLPQEKGIKDVRCDLSNSQVAVTYQKDKTDPEQIKRSIEKLGYTAKQNPAQPDKKEK